MDFRRTAEGGVITWQQKQKEFFKIVHIFLMILYDDKAFIHNNLRNYEGYKISYKQKANMKIG